MELYQLKDFIELIIITTYNNHVNSNNGFSQEIYKVLDTISPVVRFRKRSKYRFDHLSLMLSALYITLHQGLPFHSTNVQREFTPFACALLFSRRSAHMSADAIIFFFQVYTQKIFYVKNFSFFFNSKSSS